MKIAFAFVGFLRDLKYIDGLDYKIDRLIESIGLSSFQVDVYYSCPHLSNEFDTVSLSQEEIENSMRENTRYPFLVKLRHYNPFKYVEACLENSLPFKTKTDLFPNRILSFVDSFSQTSALIDSKKYDFVVYTRLDMLHVIYNLGQVNIDLIKDNIFCWRSNPYLSSEEAEDRIIFGSPVLIDLLCNYYKDLFKNEVDHKRYSKFWFQSEYLLGRHLEKYKPTNINLSPQVGVELDQSPFLAQKYTRKTFNNYFRLFKEYLLKRYSLT